MNSKFHLPFFGIPYSGKTNHKFLLILLGIFSFAAAQQEPTKDSVQYKLDPVLVTGTTARERETPVTFTNIGKGLIQQRYSMQDVPVLLAEQPSMISYSDGGNGIGYNFIFLRGFDQRRLSIMVNGVPQNDPEDHNVYWIDFPDVLASSSNVQVQRGAGSAFYGPPAIGGSINIITNPFTAKPYAKFESMFGFQEYGDSSQALPMTMRKLAVSFNSGAIDGKYIFYGRLGKIQSNGYRIHSAIEMGSYFFGALRFDENMTTRIHLFGGPIEDKLVYTGLPKFANNDLKLRRMNLSYWEFDSTGKNYGYTTLRRLQETERFNQPHYEIINDWQVADDMHLHNTVFFYDSHGWFDYDGSWADAATLRVDSTFGFAPTPGIANAIIRGGVDLVQWGWLPRVEWQHDRGELTIGGEYRYHKGTHWGKIQYAEGLPANYDPDYRFYQYDGIKHMASLYVTENFKIDEQTTLMANVQYAFNEYQIQNEKFLGHSFSVPYHFINPRVGVNYNIDEEWNAYISFGYTSREPRLRNLYAAEDAYFGATPAFAADTIGGVANYDFNTPIARPEQLINLELGTGYKSPDALLNANVYWMEFTDELVKSGQVDIFGNPVYGNAPRTRHIGLELEASIRLIDQFVISGNGAVSSNRIVEFSTVDSSVNGVVYRTKLNDNPIAGFPDVLGNLRFTFEREGLTASLLVKYVGSFYTDNFNDANNKNDAYTVLNFESLYILPKFGDAEISLRAEARNLLNKLYMQNGEGNAFFPAAERNYLIGLTVQF
ncbi:MAG: TonB-dependent receptor [Ignavibacteriales bacterium]|nr:TonB-dependent receptor [Ignavibacteriales bacterium]